MTQPKPKGEEAILEEDEGSIMATSDEDSDSTQEPWVEWFCRLKGNEFFCEVSNRAPGCGIFSSMQKPALIRSSASPDFCLPLLPCSRLIPEIFRHFYYLQVDRYFIEDRFNLFGLSHIVDNYKLSMDFILDRGSECSDTIAHSLFNNRII